MTIEGKGRNKNLLNEFYMNFKTIDYLLGYPENLEINMSLAI